MIRHSSEEVGNIWPACILAVFWTLTHVRHSGILILNSVVMKMAWWAAGLWSISLGQWTLRHLPVWPLTLQCRSKFTDETFEQYGEWRFVQGRWGCLCFPTFPENWLASLSCISPPTKLSRGQSISLWGAAHWWFIWGSPAKRSECLTGLHQNISSSLPHCLSLFLSIRC